MNNKWISTQLGNDVQGNSHALTGHASTSHVHVLAAGLCDAYATSGMSGHVSVTRGFADGSRVLEGGLFLRPRLERTDAELSGTAREGFGLKGFGRKGFEGIVLDQVLTGSTGLGKAFASTSRRTSDHTTSLSIQQSRDLVPIG